MIRKTNQIKKSKCELKNENLTPLNLLKIKTKLINKLKKKHSRRQKNYILID